MDHVLRHLTIGDSATLACTTIGAGQPVILVLSWHTTIAHQLTSTANQPFYAHLASRLALTAYDRRGVGASSRNASTVAIDAQVADLLAIVDAAGTGACHLTADNDGCYVAARFAALHSLRVRKMILWSPFVGGHDARPNGMREFAQLMRRDYAEACRQWAELTPDVTTDEERRALAADLASRVSATNAADYMEWEADEDISGVLPQVPTPTLVLASRRLGTRSMGVASLLPNGRFETVDADPATGVLDVADVARRMTDFLE